MGANFVKNTKIEASTGTTVSGTIPAPASGNALLVVGAQYQGTGSSATCTDNKSNTYTAIANQRAGAIQDGNAWANGWIAPNVTNGPTSVTVTVGSGASGGTYEVIEVSGASSSNPIDAAVTASGTSNTESTGTLSAKAGDLVVAWTADDQATNPATLTPPASPWTTDGTELNAAAYQDLSVVYQNSVSAGSFSASWTGAGTPKWAAIIVGILAGATAQNATVAPTAAASAQTSLGPTLRLDQTAASAPSIETDCSLLPLASAGAGVLPTAAAAGQAVSGPTLTLGQTLVPVPAGAGTVSASPTVSLGGTVSIAPTAADGQGQATAPLVAVSLALPLSVGTPQAVVSTPAVSVGSGVILAPPPSGEQIVPGQPAVVIGFGVLVGPGILPLHGIASTPSAAVGATLVPVPVSAGTISVSPTVSLNGAVNVSPTVTVGRGQVLGPLVLIITMLTLSVGASQTAVGAPAVFLIRVVQAGPVLGLSYIELMSINHSVDY